MPKRKIQKDQPTKRTSHYYKKRLEESEDLIKQEQNILKSQDTQKAPKIKKQAKLRAKQARQRKKQYIMLLQHKIQLLQRQLAQYKKKNTQEKHVIHSVNSAFVNLNKAQKQLQPTIDKRHTNINLPKNQVVQETIKLEGIKSQFSRLYGYVKQQNQFLTGQSLSVLRQKFGAAGKQRFTWINELFLKMVSVLMPMHCRLFLEHCQNQQQFYELLGGKKNLKQIIYSERQKKSILERRSALCDLKHDYQIILHKIKQLLFNIEYQATRMQNQVDLIEKSMSPLFVGKLLVHLDFERRAQQNLQNIFPINYFSQCMKQNPEENQDFFDKNQKMQCNYNFIDQDEFYILNEIL